MLGSDNDSEEREESNKLFDVSNASKDMKEIRLNETQNMIFSSSILHINDELLVDDYLVMDVKGSGILDVQIINEEKNKTLLKFGKVTNSKVTHEKRVVFSTFFLRGFKGGYLKLDLDSVFLGEQLSIRLEGIKYFQLFFGEPLKLFTEFTHDINIKVSIRPNATLSERSRFQFTVNTNLEHEDLNGDEFLNLLINY